jgi:hypothetical protein
MNFKFDFNVIEVAEKASLRSAPALYIHDKLNLNNEASTHRMTQLAHRLGTSLSAIDMAKKDLVQIMATVINMDKSFDFEKRTVKKYKGMIDVQSVIGTMLRWGGDYIQYYIPHIFKDDRLVRYTFPLTGLAFYPESDATQTMCVITETEGSRMVDYISTVTDTVISYSDTLLTFTLPGFHGKRKFSAVFKVSGTLNSKSTKTTYAFNVDPDAVLDYSSDYMKGEGLGMNNVLQLLAKGPFLYVDGNFLPYYVESGGLERGKIIIHVFNMDNNNGLLHMFNSMADSLQNLLISLLRTISLGKGPTTVVEFQRGLGSEFPINFLTMLGNYANGLESMSTGREAGVRPDTYEFLKSLFGVGGKSKADYRFTNIIKSKMRDVELTCRALIRMVLIFSNLKDLIDYNRKDDMYKNVMTNEKRKEVRNRIQALVTKPGFIDTLSQIIDTTTDSAMIMLSEGNEDPEMLEKEYTKMADTLKLCAEYVNKNASSLL